MCVWITLQDVTKSALMMGCVFNAKMGIQCQGISVYVQRNSIIDVISMKMRINVMSARITLWKKMDNAFYPTNQLILQQSLTLLLEEIIIMGYLEELEE